MEKFNPKPKQENLNGANKEKKYLYHRVPDNLKGNIIYPLNELKDIHPDLYISNKENYKGI